MHPGDTVELAVTLAGENGVEVTKNVRYPIQIGCQPEHTLQFTIADASTNQLHRIPAVDRDSAEVALPGGGVSQSSKAEHQRLRACLAHGPAHVFRCRAPDLPDPPSSVALLLSKSQSTPMNLFLMHGSTLALLPIDAGSAVVNGGFENRSGGNQRMNLLRFGIVSWPPCFRWACRHVNHLGKPNSYQDFVKGRFSEVHSTQDGRLTLAPSLDTLFNSGQPVIWSVSLRAPDGSYYAGTGHRGRVYKIGADGKSTLLWSSDQPEVFALAVDATGAGLYAATSPDGKVYRLQNGKAAEFFAPKGKYIWSLAIAKDGALFVGTGEPANIYRVDKTGKGEQCYETGQSHVTSTWRLTLRGATAGGYRTERNPISHQRQGQGRFVLSTMRNLPEIRSIVPMPDGTIYAAALGGSLSKPQRTGDIFTPWQSTSITVSGAGNLNHRDRLERPVRTGRQAENGSQQTAGRDHMRNPWPNPAPLLRWPVWTSRRFTRSIPIRRSRQSGPRRTKTSTISWPTLTARFTWRPTRRVASTA